MLFQQVLGSVRKHLATSSRVVSASAARNAERYVAKAIVTSPPLCAALLAKRPSDINLDVIKGAAQFAALAEDRGGAIAAVWGGVLRILQRPDMHQRFKLVAKELSKYGSRFDDAMEDRQAVDDEDIVDEQEEGSYDRAQKLLDLTKGAKPLPSLSKAVQTQKERRPASNKMGSRGQALLDKADKSLEVDRLEKEFMERSAKKAPAAPAPAPAPAPSSAKKGERCPRGTQRNSEGKCDPKLSKAKPTKKAPAKKAAKKATTKVAKKATTKKVAKKAPAAPAKKPRSEKQLANDQRLREQALARRKTKASVIRALLATADILEAA